MVAKIARGTSVEGMVLYNHNKAIGKDGRQPSALLLGYNSMADGEYNTIVKTLLTQNQLNSNVSKPNIHISLNFHRDDILSNDKIFDISRRYMQEMGYDEQPYAVYRHFDTEHPHVHIVSTQIDFNGKFINDSYIFRKSERTNRKLENEFMITKAVEHNTILDKGDLKLCIVEHLEKGRGPLVATLRAVLDECLKLRPISFDEFDFFLKNYQVLRSELDSDSGGHVFQIVELDQLELEKSSSKHAGIGGAEIGSDYTYQALSKVIELNKKGKQVVKRNLQGRLYAITNSITNKISLTEFELELKRKGISVKVKRRQTGEHAGAINGFVFADMKTGFRYSASELNYKSKDLISKLWDDGQDLRSDVQTNIDGRGISGSESKDNVAIDFGQPVQMEVDYESILSAFSSIFDSHFIHNEENELLMKKKKKKKKRKK